MKKIIINGGKKLNGTIRISGAKNAAVALIPASILSDETVTICNVPEISDTNALEEILNFLNVKVQRATETMIIDATLMENKSIPEEIAKKLRASYYFMGALLSKYKYVEMSFPGGCNIGARPINLHLEGFNKLGATVIEQGNKYIIKADKLKGSNIKLDVASVGATINIMLAAVKAEGITTLENAACEPEIINVAELLNNMGAKITGAGTSIITIEGVEKLKSGFIEVIPDRIEAGTYILASALIGENLKISNVVFEHLESLLENIEKTGINVIKDEDYIICKKEKPLESIDLETSYFPGFPTDLQQPFSVLLTQCNGTSKLTENIWENRFMHVKHLNNMGANIEVENRTSIIKGPTKLIGTEVIATDLRAGAALVLAGLIAEKTTTITDIEHILRGYEGIIEKLQNVGADIKICE